MTVYDKEHSNTGDLIKCDHCEEEVSEDYLHFVGFDGEEQVCEECLDDMVYGTCNEQAASDYRRSVL